MSSSNKVHCEVDCTLSQQILSCPKRLVPFFMGVRDLEPRMAIKEYPKLCSIGYNFGDTLYADISIKRKEKINYLYQLTYTIS